ncbi:MAG: RNA-binding cell elongation regulator Jag/EloR [Limnochordia bacterium]|jgi:spoIIIJ-associated protein
MLMVEKTGRTVEEAIEAALEELEVPREQVEVEVIDSGAKGLFGIIGTKQARVRVSVKPTLDHKAQRAAQWLQELLEKMGIEAQVHWSLEDDVIRLDIIGQSLGLVIGKRGQTLDALQYLTSLVANRGEGPWNRVLLDAENYRRRREESLRGLAQRLADKAVRNGRRVILEPMNAHERRIIHLALQDQGNVDTYSEGTDPYRRVIIAPK